MAAPGLAAVALATQIVARLDPAAHRIEASASLEVANARAPVFELARSLEPQEASCDGASVPFEVLAKAEEQALARVTLRPKGRVSRCTLRYAGTLYDPPSVAQFSRERIADQTQGTIEEAGVFLAPESGWYPRPPSASPGTFRLEVHVPAGWDAVAEGSETTRALGSSGTRIVFESAQPSEGLHLVAGPWKRFEEKHGAMKVAAFVYAEDEALAAPYLAGIHRYLDLYSGWLGPHAYDRFAVVENFFSTGYGMPGFTVLGQDVMRLPFIVDTSLGHEVAHDWWGNGVLVEEAGGNWSEGLTTYVADYQYKRVQGEEAAAEYRREVCRDYTNYVSSAGSDFPLALFSERTTAASRAVGYGKTMMVFHMLERKLGKERFDEVLRGVYREHLHRRAGWDTWRAAFSKAAGSSLSWFFEQWVARPGAPLLEKGRFSVASAGDGYEVSGSLFQRGGTWRLEVPVVFEADGRSERRVLELKGETTALRVRLPFRPSRLRIDPEQDVFRRLDPAEMPPVLSRVLGDPKALVVVDDTSGEPLAAAYREIAQTLTASGSGELVSASGLAASAFEGRNVLLLGLPAEGPARSLTEHLPQEVSLEPDAFRVSGTAYGQPGATLLVVTRMPSDATRAVALFLGATPDGVRAAGRKLVHYGKYSYLAFVDGKNQAKGVSTVEDGPLVVELP